MAKKDAKTQKLQQDELFSHDKQQAPQNNAQEGCEDIDKLNACCNKLLESVSTTLDNPSAYLSIDDYKTTSSVINELIKAKRGIEEWRQAKKNTNNAITNEQVASALIMLEKMQKAIKKK